MSSSAIVLRANRIAVVTCGLTPGLMLHPNTYECAQSKNWVIETVEEAWSYELCQIFDHRSIFPLQYTEIGSDASTGMMDGVTELQAPT